MKTKYLILILLIIITLPSFAQLNEAFNYQAIIRKADGTVIQNQEISVVFTIEDINGTVYYSEQHDLVTDSYGVINQSIGEGVPLVGEFGTINWNTSLNLKVEIDYDDDGSVDITGSTAIKAVPKAGFAQKAALADSLSYDLANVATSGDFHDLENKPSLVLTETQLSIEGGNSVDLSSLIPSAAEQVLSVSGNVLSISGGNSVNLPSANDDQTAGEVGVSASGNLTSTDVQSALLELQGDIDAGSTDDQNLTGATLTGTSLQIDIEGGSSATVNLAGLQDGTGTDDQLASEVAYDNSTSGLSASDVKSAIDELAVSAGSDDQTAVEVPVSASGNLSSTDVQTALVELQGDIDGIDDTDDQNLTGASLTGTSLQIDIEGGTSATVDLAALQDGTGTDDQTAGEVAYNNSTSGLSASDVKSAIDELAVSAGSDDQTAVEVAVTASGNLSSTDVQSALVELQGDIDGIDDTDDQNLTGATLTGTSLQIDIEGGSSATVDLAGLQDGTGTDDQTASEVAYDNSTSGLSASDVKSAIDELAVSADSDDQTAVEVPVSASGNLSSTDVQSALVELQGDIDGIDDTDDQNLTGATLTGTSLQIDIEGGSSATVDLAGLQDGTGTDDQNAAEVTYNNSTSGLSATDVKSAIDELAVSAGSDDQTAVEVPVSASGNLSSTDVQTALVELQGDIDGIDDTDDQNLTGATLTGTSLQIDIEGGTSATVDLAGLQDGTGTDDQNAAEVTYNNSTSGLSATDVKAAIDELAVSAGSDDQTAVEVPVSASGNLSSTDVQTALVELQGDIDGIDDTDDQNLTGATLTGTSLQIDIEGGTSVTVDLAGLQDGTGTDDQNAAEVTYNNSTSGLSASDVKSAIDELAVSAGSDDQTAVEVPVSASGNLSSTDVQTALVELQGDIDGIDDTDDQNLTGATLTGTSLQIDIEGGTSATVDLAGLQDGTGTDDQTAGEVAYDNSTSGLSASDVKSAIDELAVSAGSDDQTAVEVAVTASGNLTSTDVQTALVELQGDIDGIDDTDDQNLTGATLTGTSLQIDIEGGTSATVDLAGLQDGTGTDDQTASEVSVISQNGIASTYVQSALEELQGEIDGKDGSITNEGSLSVEAGSATTSIIRSNTSGSNDITLDAGTNITISEVGNTITIAAAGSSDDLGNHTATENLKLGANYLSNDGDASEGLNFDTDGNATLSHDLAILGADLTLGEGTTAAPGKILLHDNQSGDSFTTTIQAAADVDADLTLTLPADAGANGDVLSTDGSGNLTWTTASGGGNVVYKAGPEVADDDKYAIVKASGTGVNVVKAGNETTVTIPDGVILDYVSLALDNTGNTYSSEYIIEFVFPAASGFFTGTDLADATSWFFPQVQFMEYTGIGMFPLGAATPGKYLVDDVGRPNYEFYEMGDLGSGGNSLKIKITNLDSWQGPFTVSFNW